MLPGRLRSLGSSPLSRGIRMRIEGPGFERRIIPALAGNTRPAGLSGCTATDHPRSRGEYVFFHNLAFDGDGSSPLSRGILQPQLIMHPPQRIIPALAGNTSTLR